MELYHREFGGEGNPPMILLHGLLGSSRNWVTVGRLLASHFHVIALDLRNHGNSPHDATTDFETMGLDVMDWINRNAMESVHMVGHSMGGKVAMWLACNFPERVSSLIIADIAPKVYNRHFLPAFEGMRQVDANQFTRISDVEQALSTTVDDSVLRQFLVTNLKRNEAGTFDWQVNVEGLANALPVISANALTPDMHYDGPTLLLHGAKSTFVLPDDHTLVRHHFPKCSIVEVPDSGHNVHVENRQFFVENVFGLFH